MDSSALHGRFADQVRRTPDAVAVTATDGSGVRLTYRQLDERANQVAHRLIGLGVGAEVPVAVLMERSVDVVVAILGIVKAGAAYLPLHDSYPTDRMQWVVDQSGATVLLTDEALVERAPTVGSVLTVGADPETAAQPVTDPRVHTDPGQLAYVIYTSGSTGHPKGVAVPHWDALGLALDSIWDTGRHERVLMVAPHAFNVSTYELWVPLLHGGEIVVAPPGTPDVATLRRLLGEYAITGVHLTAGLFRVVAEEDPTALAGVREVLTGGDVIAPTAVARVLEANPDLVVRAMWGATELTLFSTHLPLTAPYTPGKSVPIGAPMNGVKLHILDDRLDLLPNGIDGEIYVSGRGVARGYFGKPELTVERFVANPYGPPGDRMYRTGDLGRRNPDGTIEFLGREGEQVKVLGFRVELAEIEAVLNRYPGLAHVAVVAKETSSGEKRLVGYVVPEDGEADTGAIRAHAAEALPEYMVPAAVVALDALPLTPNGKVDRRALPEPDFDAAVAYRAPTDAVQEVLCSIFADVLGVERVGIDDSFFDLGGQSLFAMRLVSRIRSVMDRDVPISVLFDRPTVAGLSKHLETATK